MGDAYRRMDTCFLGGEGRTRAITDDAHRLFKLGGSTLPGTASGDTGPGVGEPRLVGINGLHG